ncbi:MAG TPA: cupin domain-containing protein [Streptosporangiaceae bacterium]|jgi:mannose-6-phosphate isomerase-like protein (cupin superfamily)
MDRADRLRAAAARARPRGRGFYLLDGQITVECGDRRWQAGPGDFAFLPRGVPHAFIVTDGPVRGLQIAAPAGFERFVRELGRPAERPGLPDPSGPTSSC